MQRKCMIWFVVFAIDAGICYWGWHRADNKFDQHTGQESNDTDREIAEKEELPTIEAEEPTDAEETLEIVAADPFTVVEDWAVSEETFRIEGEGFEKLELCGISEEQIYFSYSLSDDTAMTLVYCMFDRATKETKILHELEVRDAVFPPITYNEHMYILDVKVPSYKIWDICEEETTLYGEGECLYYPQLQLCGSKLVIGVHQQKGADVVCTLSWADLLTKESAVIETTKYKYDSERNVANGTEICHADGWEDGVIFETYSYDEEPRQTWQRKKDYGEQEIWYYDFAAGTTTKQALTLGRHSYYVGGDESCIVIDRASLVDALPKSGTMYERTQSGYVSRKIPSVDATNSIVHAGKLANGQILLDCREGFVLIDPKNNICTGEDTYHCTYSDTEIAFMNEDGVVHVRKYVE